MIILFQNIIILKEGFKKRDLPTEGKVLTFYFQPRELIFGMQASF